MAAIVVLLGSLAGLLAAAVAWFVHDAHPLVALAFWLGSGPASALAVLALGLQAPPAEEEERRVLVRA